MATKADFTEDEWKALQRGVTGAGMLVSLGDADFTDSFGEASALAKYLTEQRQKGGTELIREIASTHGTGFGLFTSPHKAEAETVEALHEATAALAAKAPEEADGYRELVLGVANHVANAKGGVKEGETAAIGKITAALTSPTA